MNLRAHALALLALSPLALLACHDGRDANDPMLKNRKVEVMNEPGEGCKKIGTVHGIGRDGNEELSKQQAADAAIDEAKRIYGNAIVFTDEKGEQLAGSGGTVTQTTKTGEVYDCPKSEKKDEKKEEKTEDKKEDKTEEKSEGGEKKE